MFAKIEKTGEQIGVFVDGIVTMRGDKVRIRLINEEQEAEDEEIDARVPSPVTSVVLHR